MEKIKMERNIDESTSHMGTLDNFCHTCLSSGRRYYPLNKYSNLKEMFSRICNKNCKKLYHIFLCWECITVLHKARQLARRAACSQTILSEYYQSNKRIPPTSLSSLNVSKTQLEDVNNTNREEYDKKLEIKTELETYNEYTNELEDFDNDLINNDFIDNIKKEDSVTVCKESKSVFKSKSKKSKRYRYVFDKIVRKDVNRLSRKIKIVQSDINYWLEKERQCTIYKNSKYKCHSCVFSWRTEKGLMEHNEKYHSTTNRYTCDVCKCRFPKKIQLVNHLQRHLILRECGTCRHRGNARHMTRHLAQHTKRLQCTDCGIDGFSSVRQVYLHQRDLHEVYICDHCAKRCRSKHMLEKHMRRHFEKYECKLCDRRYKTRATYRKHYNVKHGESTGEDAYCAPCGKQFNNSALYRRHVASSVAHRAERDARRNTEEVPCPVCGRVYSRKTYMMNHYRHVHKNQSNYYCELCDKYFLNRTRYVEHVKYKHEGVKKEKNKLCNICGRGFAANKTLVNHIRTHSGERPFECPHCGGKFTQKHAMLSHVRHVHLDSKRKGWQS